MCVFLGDCGCLIAKQHLCCNFVLYVDISMGSPHHPPSDSLRRRGDCMYKKIQEYSFDTIQQMFSINEDFVVIAGPCSVESEKQINDIGAYLHKENIRFLRGGAFKPRTSPYDFQGLGVDGLKLLQNVKKQYGFFIVSEIMDPRDVELGIQYTDVIQIGSRNMQNYSLLKEVGKIQHPVLLKRGYMSTVDEFLHAAEYIMVNGNHKIILCERGIRSFDSITRNQLDISCVAYIKTYFSVPVIVDISHSLGRKDIVLPIAKAVKAVGADGLMVEVHNSPSSAYSDSYQQLDFQEFHRLIGALM